MSNKVRQEVLDVNGVQMGVVIFGEQRTKRALVLLHGFTGSASGWNELLTELALPGMRVIALDMLGHGRSDAPADPGRYAMEHCQMDLIAALQLLDVQAGEAILLGYSMGGRIALYCAFSGFFRALILESASPGLADPIEREQRRRNDEELASSIERDGIESFVGLWERLPLFASQSHLPEEKRAALHLQRLHNQASGLANSLRGVGTGTQPSLYACLPALNIPVLLIAGALDAKFCTLARQMQACLPQACLQIVAAAGHTVHLEQGREFGALVRQFCASC